MDDDITATIRLARRPRVYTDAVGGTVWKDDVETTELELISTQALEALIIDDEGTMAKLRRLETSDDGVLAQDRHSDAFHVVPREDLQAALADSGRFQMPPEAEVPSRYVAEQVADDIEELTLVSTQVLRKLLDEPGLSPKQAADELKLLDEPGASDGFDPYNRG